MNYRPADQQYDDRYSSSWSHTSRMARKAVNYRCCNCWWRRADSTHHAQYSFYDCLGIRRKVKDHERQEVGRSLFPVCGESEESGSCHYWLHCKGNWIVNRSDRVWGNRNTPAALNQLRVRFWLLRFSQKTSWIWQGVIVGFAIAWVRSDPSHLKLIMAFLRHALKSVGVQL